MHLYATRSHSAKGLHQVRCRVCFISAWHRRVFITNRNGLVYRPEIIEPKFHLHRKYGHRGRDGYLLSVDVTHTSDVRMRCDIWYISGIAIHPHTSDSSGETGSGNLACIFWVSDDEHGYAIRRWTTCIRYA